MKKRSPRHTVLLIGEGKTERVFFEHLKSLYIQRYCDVNVTIYTANGGNPDHIVNFAIRRPYQSEFDRTLVLLDNDVQIKKSVHNKAKRKKIQLVESTPCFEGLLLKILTEKVPKKSKQCKQECECHFTGSLTDPEKYTILTKEYLTQRRADVPELEQILASFTFDD